MPVVVLQGDPFALPVWLLMDCTENAVPRLQYTSAAIANQFFSALNGYSAIGSQLPSLNAYGPPSHKPFNTPSRLLLWTPFTSCWIGGGIAIH
jgi:hypothetical protein